MDTQLIDSLPALKTFIEGLPDLNKPDPILYVDLEGNNLSRKGTLSLVTILVKPRHTVHIIDVTGLGRDAFDTPSAGGNTIRQILESTSIIKVFFDIRNDSDALFSHFGVRVAGIEDLQLMELASRNFSKRHVNGLAKCIERDSTLSYSEKQDWRADKNRGHNLFDAAQGGDYGVFDKRPLSTEMIKYCAQDVIHMPRLREVYREKLCDAWWLKIEQETLARIALSQGSNYNGKGMHMAVGPSAWNQWRPNMQESQTRTLFNKPPEPLEEPQPASKNEVAAAQSPKNTSEEPNPVVFKASSGRQAHSDNDDNNGDDDEFEYSSPSFGYRSTHYSGWDDESDGDRDMTACDKECGYCGRCMY